MAARSLHCVVLRAYRIWNVAYAPAPDEGGDCVMWDEELEEAGAFGARLAFNGTHGAFAEPFAFEAARTPVIDRVAPPTECRAR